MADFHKMTVDLIMADSKITEDEVKILKKHLYADGKINRDEVALLVDLRAAAVKKGKRLDPSFDKLFLKALADNILANRIISAEEVGMIKKHVVNGKKFDTAEVKRFLSKLKKEARPNPAFDKVCDAYAG